MKSLRFICSFSEGRRSSSPDSSGTPEAGRSSAVASCVNFSLFEPIRSRIVNSHRPKRFSMG